MIVVNQDSLQVHITCNLALNSWKIYRLCFYKFSSTSGLVSTNPTADMLAVLLFSLTLTVIFAYNTFCTYYFILLLLLCCIYYMQFQRVGSWQLPCRCNTFPCSMGACLSLDDEERKAKHLSDQIDVRLHAWGRSDRGVIKILLLGRKTDLWTCTLFEPVAGYWLSLGA